MDDDLDPIRRLSREQHNVLLDCCLGRFEDVWYKFKRFEDLSLLNLYYYQHQLVLLDKEIFGDPEGDYFGGEPLSNAKWRQMRRYLKGYQEAMQLFKQTQQQQRPP